MIYIIMMLLSLLCFVVSAKVKKYRLIYWVLISLGIFLPCMLAALRGLKVGTDVNVYVYPVHVHSLRFDNFFTFVNSFTAITDYMYLLVTYICSHIFGSHQPLFFVFELLVIMPLFMALKRRNNDKVLILGMFLFYMFWYNQTLNMVRQSIAISFCILSISFMEEKFDFKVILSFLIGFMFHYSAFIVLLVYLLAFFFNPKRFTAKTRDIFKIIITGIILFGLFFIPEIIKFLGDLNIISSAKYNTYAVEYIRKDFDFSYIKTFIYVYIFILLKMYSNNTDLRMKHLYIYLSFISIFILQIGGMIEFAERLSFYLFYPVLFYALPCFMYEKDQKGKLIKPLSMIVFIAYFGYWVLYLNYDSTLPYVLYNQ